MLSVTGVGGTNARLTWICCRLRGIFDALKGRARLVLHGTNDFPPDLCRAAIEAGVTKLNVNKLLLKPWNEHLRANVHLPLTQLMEEGIDVLTRETERWMDIVGSSGKAGATSIVREP